MSGHNVLHQIARGPSEVVDPGSGNPIVVDRYNQYIPLTIAASASETNTLPDPIGVGYKLTVMAMTVGSGGTRTITAASAVNSAGDTSLVFNAVDDRVVLESVRVGTDDYEWRIVDVESVTGSEVGAALTAQLTTITHTAAGTPDYALQNLVQNTGFGFATADEGNTCLAVIANLQARCAEIEARLEAANIVAAN